MMESGFYSEELFKMRQKYKNNPLKDIKLNRPEWLTSKDPMSEIYSKKSMLLQKGEIVYANIIQANTILFDKTPKVDCPAHIVFSTDPYFAEKPEALYEIAWNIYTYKGKTPDTVPDEWKEVAKVITDEYDRSDFAFSLDIDAQLFEIKMIPTMIYRSLLPKGKLCGNLLPVLTAPECKQVLVLPKRYWSRKFKKAWKKGNV